MNVDSPAKLPTVLSLCTGYGGIERGLELAGFEHRTIAYVEIEAYPITNLANKMEAGKLLPAPIWTNLKTLPVDCFRDRVDLVTGGYPCQPFSAAGQRKGKDDPRHLWPYIHDIIQAVRPFRCFFENVEGHISLGLREVIEDLEGLGYKTTFGIFSASEVGAPHQRKRVFILANAKSREPRLKLANPDQEGTMANSDSFSLQGVRSNEHQEGRQRQEEKPTGLCSGTEICDFELNLGRGFDGVASWLDGSWELGIPRVTSDQKNRADRLRLLGNGVCPPTAAKAWIVLNEQIIQENG